MQHFHHREWVFPVNVCKVAPALFKIEFLPKYTVVYANSKAHFFCKRYRNSFFTIIHVFINASFQNGGRANYLFSPFERFSRNRFVYLFWMVQILRKIAKFDLRKRHVLVRKLKTVNMCRKVESETMAGSDTRFRISCGRRPRICLFILFVFGMNSKFSMSEMPYWRRLSFVWIARE